MSYCRFSSDNFKCDVYAYEYEQGCYKIHVASNRIVGDAPPHDFSSPEKFLQQEKLRREFFDNCTREPIGLPHDGEDFDCTGLDELEQTLKMLKDAGYIVPDWVFETIDEEKLKVAPARKRKAKKSGA